MLKKSLIQQKLSKQIKVGAVSMQPVCKKNKNAQNDVARLEQIRNKISNWRVAGAPYGDVVSLIGGDIGISKETSITDLALELKPPSIFKPLNYINAPHMLISFYENNNFVRNSGIK